MRQLRIIWLFWLWLSLSGGWARAEPEPAPFPFAGVRFAPAAAEAEAIWQRHLAASHRTPLQSACEPFRLPARGIHRGGVILLHGFTACPQQFWGLAPQLAAAGFDVFVPLLPGHGRRYTFSQGKAVDDIAFMPADQDYRIYQDFSVEISGLLQAETGRRLIGGLSLGGVIATTALERLPDFYDRALLLSPLFDVVRPSNWYVPSANWFLPRLPTDWGPGCEAERAGGRGGYCQFTPALVRAVQLVGKEALAQAARVKTTVQVVGVEGDWAADNVAIGRAVRRLPFVRACLFRQGANHSLLSRYDAPEENKFWLPTLEQQAVGFLADADFFPVTAGGEEGLARCRLP